MKTIPSLCVDNFYSDPDKVREFALSLDYLKDDKGRWPGVRSQELFSVDREFHELFSKKVFSLFYDFKKTYLTWSVRTMFQIIHPYDTDPSSPKNTGWIHWDEGSVFAGIIYLNKEFSYSNGTSLYKLIDETKLDMGDTKEEFYLYGNDKNYDEKILEHNSAFVETVRYYNVYNRLICFDTSEAHGANNFFNEKEPRLTQVFFVDEFTSSSESAILRHQQYL